MSELFRLVDIGIANEEDCQAALGIQADVDVHPASLDAALIAASREGSERVSESENAGHHAARIEKRVAQRLVGVPARSARNSC